MKRKLLATAALALAMAACPAYAQTGTPSPGGMGSGSGQGTGTGGGSMQREQDQGIKTGQTGGATDQRGGSASQMSPGGSSGSESRGTQDKTTGSTEKRDKNEKNATQPDRSKQHADERDRDQRVTSPESKDSKRATDRTQDRDRQATDKDKNQDRNAADRNDSNRMSKDSTSKSGKSVNIDRSQQTKVSVAIRSARVQPETRLSISVRVGTRVPASVHFYTLPAEVVEIVPQYRGYLYFVYEDQIIIVEPDTHEIVTIIPYSAASTGSKARFSSSERSTIRTRMQAEPHRRAVTQRTVTSYEVGETIPEDVEIYDMPPAVYAELPEVRSYRYLPRERGGVVVVEPRARRVIDVID